jgi:hypothetical protein
MQRAVELLPADSTSDLELLWKHASILHFGQIYFLTNHLPGRRVRFCRLKLGFFLKVNLWCFAGVFEKKGWQDVVFLW